MQDELNILEYWRILMRRKKGIAIFVFFVTASAICYSLLATKLYTAEASLLPVGGDKPFNLSAMFSQSPLGGLLGDVGGSNPATPIMAALESRSMSEIIIKKYNLMQHFFKDRWDEESGSWKSGDPKKAPHIELGIKKLRQHVAVLNDKKTKLITISGEFDDPKLAEQVVNGYVAELTNFLGRNELTTAKRNRVFIEGQLESNKALLLETGKELADFYGNHQISNSDSLIDVDVSLRKPVINSFASDGNEPKNDIQAEASDLSASRDIEQLENMRLALNEKLKSARLVEDVPQQVYLEYLTAYFQLLGQMNALLTQEYEMARIKEAKEDITFQIIDRAQVPFYRSSPRRSLIVVSAFGIACIMGVVFAFLTDYIQTLKVMEEAEEFDGNETDLRSIA